MTDEDLVKKKLAFIETCLNDLRRLGRPDQLDDLKERRFVEHTLQICLQAIQDVASHVTSDEKLGEPRTNAELFSLLARGNWITPELAEILRAAIGFRNVLVHGYTDVDLIIMRDVLINRLVDLQAFVDQIRARIR